jgi:methyl-accepting chemotaxis protein
MQALAAIQTLILHVGDTSALTLDPDLDSYYLMDATVVALPTVLGLLQEIAARDSWASVDAASFTARVEISANRAIDAFETALREDGNFYEPKSGS